jgi:uncharacterized protein YegL
MPGALYGIDLANGPGQQAQSSDTITGHHRLALAKGACVPSRPGGPLASRPLHFIWIADCSGSMRLDGRIQALNTAIREAVPHLRDVAADNPNALVLLRVLRFGSGAAWHVSQPTPVDEYRHDDLEAEGVTDLGAALDLLATELQVPAMPERALPPVLVLVSDGRPTDDYRAALTRLLREPWGAKAVRLAIAIGRDADVEVLEQFIGTEGVAPLRASTPEALVRQIRWVSAAGLQSASSPAAPTPGGAPNAGATIGVPIPGDPNAASSGSGSVGVW